MEEAQIEGAPCGGLVVQGALNAACLDVVVADPLVVLDPSLGVVLDPASEEGVAAPAETVSSDQTTS